MLAGSGTSDQDVWGVYGCNFSWRFQWHHRSVSDVDRGRYCQFVPLNFLLSLTAPHLLGVLVLVTGYKFIAGVVVTGNNCSLVSLSSVICSPMINIPPRISLHIFRKIQNSPNGILGSPRHWFMKNTQTPFKVEVWPLFSIFCPQLAKQIGVHVFVRPLLRSQTSIGRNSSYGSQCQPNVPMLQHF